MKKIWILFSLVLGVSLAGYPQVLGLRDYRQRVMNYNQDIKQSRAAAEAALYALKSVKTGFFPRLDLSGSYSYQFENVEFMEGVRLKHDNYNAEADLVQSVYAGGAVRKQYEMARVQQAIAVLGEKHTLVNMLYAADVNYWTAVANRDLYTIASRFVEIVGELYDVVDKRFREGAISRTDVLMVEARLKEAELQLNASRTNYKTALQALNIMMGEAVEAEPVLRDSIRSGVLLPSVSELAVALDNRADYQTSIRDVELARLETRLVKSNYLPQVVLGIKENWGTLLLNVDGERRFTTLAFANLSIPVFHWGERRQSVRASILQEDMRELDRSKLADQVSLELSTAWTTVSDLLKKTEIVNSSLEIAQDNLFLNTFSYNEGKLPIIDVLSAQVTWLQAYTSVVSVHYQFKVAVAEYYRAVGGE